MVFYEYHPPLPLHPTHLPFPVIWQTWHLPSLARLLPEPPHDLHNPVPLQAEHLCHSLLEEDAVVVVVLDGVL